MTGNTLKENGADQQYAREGLGTEADRVKNKRDNCPKHPPATFPATTVVFLLRGGRGAPAGPTASSLVSKLWQIYATYPCCPRYANWGASVAVLSCTVRLDQNAIDRSANWVDPLLTRFSRIRLVERTIDRG